MNQLDLAHGWTWTGSVGTVGATASVNGTSLDCRDCGPEVVAFFVVGPNNPGNDTTVNWHLEQSTDDTTFVDIAGATGTQVTGDNTGLECVQIQNRSRRYVRAVCTIAGTSPTPDVFCLLGAPLISV